MWVRVPYLSKMEPIILASSSPRRQEILHLLNIPYQVIMPNVDETMLQSLDINEVSEFLAREKVTAVVKQLTGREIQWVLGADTVILLDGKMCGKPKSPDEAADMLRIFSGKAHIVKTVIALYNGRKHLTQTRESITKVVFKNMTEDEIEWYVQTGEWHGAAGGYRIQSLGSIFIERIEGSSSGVMGLPIFELYDMLKEQGYSIIE